MIDDIDLMFKKEKCPGLKSIRLARNTIEKDDKIVIEDRIILLVFQMIQSCFLKVLD